MKLSPKISELIDSLKLFLELVRNQQKMALSLLSSNKEIGLSLLKSIEDAILNIQLCQKCYVLNDQELCEICNSANRNKINMCCRINSLIFIQLKKHLNLMAGISCLMVFSQ